MDLYILKGEIGGGPVVQIENDRVGAVCSIGCKRVR